MDTSVQFEASIYSMLTLLLCAIANTNEHVSVKNGQPKQTTPQHELYLSYTEMIEKNFCKHHGVQYYTEELGIGVHTLNACCKSNAGMTPLAVINARIIQEAKRMLLFTTMRSSEISFALGFPEQAHFINFFKRFTKISPLKYRDKHNNCLKQRRIPFFTLLRLLPNLIIDRSALIIRYAFIPFHHSLTFLSC